MPAAVPANTPSTGCPAMMPIAMPMKMARMSRKPPACGERLDMGVLCQRPTAVASAVIVNSPLTLSVGRECNR